MHQADAIYCSLQCKACRCTQPDALPVLFPSCPPTSLELGSYVRAQRGQPRSREGLQARCPKAEAACTRWRWTDSRAIIEEALLPIPCSQGGCSSWPFCTYHYTYPKAAAHKRHAATARQSQAMPCKVEMEILLSMPVRMFKLLRAVAVIAYTDSNAGF